MDPGPLTTISDILVEGNTSVNDRIVRRELPFTVGDRFSARDISEGQQQLFDLNLFRVALADVPDQPRDSTVTVRYRVRETKLRAYSGQVGYGTRPGVTMQGSWRHRNFQGNARTLVINLTADTGFPRDPSSLFQFLPTSTTKVPDRLFRASATLRQPYLFVDRLSGSIEPFVQERRSLSLDQNPDRGFSLLEQLGLNERQFGLNTTLIYSFLPFRSLSLQHTFARTEQFAGGVPRDTVSTPTDDLFDKSIFSLNGTFGKADDFINPNRGFILRPTASVGGYPPPSGVSFWRGNVELSGYLPLSESIQLAGRLSAGGLYPFGESRRNLTVPRDADSLRLAENQIYQNRFSDHLFFAGGGSDVRGWRSQLAGGKVLRNIGSDEEPEYAYRPIGAQSKIGINLEARLPFPGLGGSWRTAVFLDAAYLDTGPLNLVPAPNVSGTLAANGTAIRTAPSRLLVGTGAGLRYQTPFGFIRLDLAYKLTPDRLDLRRPDDIGGKIEEGSARPVRDAATRPIRRFRLHFGIGRSF
jgi:outer membrane protein insertion porin family